MSHVALLRNPSFVRAMFEPQIERRYKQKITALALAIVASAASEVPYLPISAQAPICPAFFATVGFLAYLKVDTWAIRATIDDLLGPTGDNEQAILDREPRNRWVSAAVITAALAIALLSQMPNVLPAFDYDQKFIVPAVISLFAGGILIPVRSLQLSIRKGVQMHNGALRSEISARASAHRVMFQHMEQTAQLEYLSFYHQQEERLVRAIFTTPITEYKREWIVQAIGLWLNGSLQAGTAIYTFNKTKQHLVDNNFVAALITVSVVLSQIYLIGQSIFDTLGRISQRGATCAEQLRPNLVRTLKLLGLIIDAGSLTSVFVIWGSFYSNDLPGKVYFDFTTALSYFLFLFTASLDVIDGLVEKIVARSGSEEEKQLIAFNHQLGRIQRWIERAPSSSMEMPTDLANS